MQTIYKISIVILLILIINSINAYADTLHIMISPTNTKFYLEDMYGKKTGRTPNGLLQQIPYADQFGRSGETGVDNPTPYQSWDEIYTSDSNAFIPPGKYKLVVFGNNISTVTMIVMRIDIYKNGSAGGGTPVDYILPGLTYTYEFEIAPTPATNNFNFTKISNPQDMIMEINAFAKIGYIGNAEFVNEIIKKIHKIEENRTETEKDDDKHTLTSNQKAKKEYQELLNEITEKLNKPEKDEFIQGLAFVALKKDLEYIIGHL